MTSLTDLVKLCVITAWGRMQKRSIEIIVGAVTFIYFFFLQE